jgi:hypothetical protein
MTETPTIPPPAAEKEDLRQFEQAINEQGENRARLANVARRLNPEEYNHANGRG